MLVASTLSVVVILAIGQVDVTRILLAQQVRRSTSLQAQAGLAMADLTKRLMQADRVNLINPPNIQFRIPEPDTDCPRVDLPSCPVVCEGCTGTVPPPCCFDIPANYRWAQYHHVDTDGDVDHRRDTIQFYDNIIRPGWREDCTPDATFPNISDLTINFRHEAKEALGGDPFDNRQDNNVLELAVSSKNPDTGATVTYRGEVTIRGGAYTDVNATCTSRNSCDSGTGLAPPGVSEPPKPCP